jgi:1D-myo-inositol-tetrakisphosphate 5-kinase/inositol-polyphosphate multikinase
MPTFLGTLTLDTQHNTSFDDQASALIAKHSIPEVVVSPTSTALLPAKTKPIATDLALVLENAAYGFVRPNIMDIKLGVRLWADDAKQEKKERFDKVTQETTHKDLGFRIAGMRVWQGEEAVQNPRRINHCITTTDDGYKIYDKNYGREDVNKNNVIEALREFIFVEDAGVDEELGQLIAQAFLADLERIREVLENEESKMYSASLLFVFEGDGKALRHAMEEASREPPATNGNGYASDDEDEEPEDLGPKIYAVKVIDFAHAEWTPGAGPDENALVGVRSVIDIMRALGDGA